MKAHKILYLCILGSMLVGCSSNISTSTSTSSTNNISSTSNSISSISSSVNESSSSLSTSDPRGPQNYELTTAMLREFYEGYQVDGIYTAYIKDEVSYTNCYFYNCTDTVYEFTSYQEVLSNPTKDTVVSAYRYEGFDFGTDTKFLTQAKLSLNNEVVNYLVTDGYGNLLTWDSTGFGNVFPELKVEYFEETENEFEFALDMSIAKLKPVYKALTAQFSSYMGLEMTSFKIKTDGYNIKEFFMDFALLATTAGQMYITVEGEFTKTGSDVVTPIEPLAGEADYEFDEMFSRLQEQNYRLDVNLGIKSYKLALEDGTKLIYDEYDKNGFKTSSYGFYQVNDEVIQGVTKINDKIYADSLPGAGSLYNVLPTLQISSVLFTLSDESTDERRIFTYREDAPSDAAFYYDYGMMAGSIVGDLTIILEDEKVTIQNKLMYSTEEFVYYDIGKVKNLFASYNKTCDNLKWSEVLSNQEKELEELYKVVPQDVMDQIPTFGGMYSKVTLDASYRPKTPVIVATVTSSAAGNELYESYVTKLLDAGFELNSEYSTDKLKAYTKECVINGETKKICVKIYFAFDAFSGSQFVVYPSIVE